jgi:hypothetical protein
METLNRNPEAQASGQHCESCTLTSAGTRCSFVSDERRQPESSRNNAARVAGPGRICFLALAVSTWHSAVRTDCSYQGIAFSDAGSRLVSRAPSGAGVATRTEFQFDSQRKMIRANSSRDFRRNHANIAAHQTMIDGNHQPAQTHERRPGS